MKEEGEEEEKEEEEKEEEEEEEEGLWWLERRKASSLNPSRAHDCFVTNSSTSCALCWMCFLTCKDRHI